MVLFSRFVCHFDISHSKVDFMLTSDVIETIAYFYRLIHGDIVTTVQLPNGRIKYIPRAMRLIASHSLGKKKKKKKML